jgi:hypothetical protein
MRRRSLVTLIIHEDGNACLTAEGSATSIDETLARLGSDVPVAAGSSREVPAHTGARAEDGAIGSGMTGLAPASP